MSILFLLFDGLVRSGAQCGGCVIVLNYGEEFFEGAHLGGTPLGTVPGLCLYCLT